MISLIPAQYRLGAVVVAFAVVAMVSASLGAKVTVWRLEAGFMGQINKLQAVNADLALQIERQNGAIYAMQIQTHGAEQVAEEARKSAAAADADRRRVLGLAGKIPAQNCRQMLEALKDFSQ